MKKFLLIIVAAVICLSMAVPAIALTPVDNIDFCYYNYLCNESVNNVNIDGIYDENEWADAAELVINDDTLQEFGRWQTNGTHPTADEFSCTYKFKWDSDYLYMLEIRTDASYVSVYGGKDYAGGRCYANDGTAIFFCDTALVEENKRFDIQFNAYVDEIKAPAVQIGTFQGPSGTSDCAYASSVNGNIITFEIKMPWALAKDQGLIESDIKDGTVFRFTPIIMTRDTIDDYDNWDGVNSTYRQINFHDCVRIPESGQLKTGDPHYFAAFTLVAAPKAAAVEAAAPEADTPAEVSAPETSAPVSAPQTGDMFALYAIAAFLVSAAAASVALTKKKSMR